MKRFWKKLALLAAVLALSLWLFTALGAFRQANAQQNRLQLEQALRRGAVACYAAEGFYPPSLGYLCTHYGVEIDEEKFVVFYEVTAENLMPSITVIERTTP